MPQDNRCGSKNYTIETKYRTVRAHPGPSEALRVVFFLVQKAFLVCYDKGADHVADGVVGRPDKPCYDLYAKHHAYGLRNRKPKGP